MAYVLVRLGLALVLAGLALLAVASLLQPAQRAGEAPAGVHVAGAACVVVFLVPICFGNIGAAALTALSLILFLLAAALAFLLRRPPR